MNVYNILVAFWFRNTRIGLLSFAVLTLVASRYDCLGVPLDIHGVVSGNINGTPWTGEGSGVGDPENGAGSVLFNFSQIPEHFDSRVPVNSVVSIICCVICREATPCADNLLNLTGGNFTVSRTFVYPDFPGSQITLSGSATTTGGQLNFSEAWSGTYNGPTDLVGIFGYHQRLVPNGYGNILQHGEALLRFSDGSEHLCVFDGSVAGFTGELTHNELVSINWSQQSADEGRLQLNWDGTVTCPETGTTIVLLLGGVGALGAFTRCRRSSKRCSARALA